MEKRCFWQFTLTLFKNCEILGFVTSIWFFVNFLKNTQEYDISGYFVFMTFFVAQTSINFWLKG